MSSISGLLTDSAAQILVTMNAIPVLRKQNAGKKRAFARDLALVGLYIRTGYLLDSFSLPDPVSVFDQFILALRRISNDSVRQIFQNVVHLYEESSEQSFFVNVPLLRTKISESSCSVTGGLQTRTQSSLSSCMAVSIPKFVGLGREGDLGVIDCPASVLELLHRLGEVLSSSHDANSNSRTSISFTALPPSSHAHPTQTHPTGSPEHEGSGHGQRDVGIERLMVPLAALILDYPIAYCPLPTHSSSGVNDGSATSSLLGGRELVVFECELVFPSTEEKIGREKEGGETRHRHRVMQFSCPKALCDDPERVGREVEEVYGARVGELGLGLGRERDVEFEVRWRVVVLDCVGL